MRVNVTEVQAGTPTVSGLFKLLFTDHMGVAAGPWGPTGEAYRWDKMHHDESAEGIRDQIHQRFPTFPQPVTVEREGPRPNGAYSWVVKLPLGTTTYNRTFFTEHDHPLDPGGQNPRTGAGDRPWPNYPKQQVHSVVKQATFHLNGTFRLEVPTMGAHGNATSYESTPPIPWDATPDEVNRLNCLKKLSTFSCCAFALLVPISFHTF